MKALMITGDRAFKPGHPRYELQRGAVERLEVLYWGRGSLWPQIPQEKFDVVTAQDSFWRGLFALYVARRLQAKLNIQVHADLEGQSYLKRMLARLVLRRASSIRVVSEKIKSQVKNVGVHAKITVLPVYIDIPKFSSVVKKGHSSKNILWMGRFEEEKNPLEAITVLKEVLKEIPEARLTMIGEGSFGQKLSDHAAHLPVIVPVGWQNPLMYLDTADVVLCTSWYESYGASIIEALAAGVPVVAPNVGVAKEAGAFVVSRKELAAKVTEVLRSSVQGALQLPLLTKEEWVQRWRQSLL